MRTQPSHSRLRHALGLEPLEDRRLLSANPLLETVASRLALDTAVVRTPENSNRVPAVVNALQNDNTDSSGFHKRPTLAPTKEVLREDDSTNIMPIKPRVDAADVKPVDAIETPTLPPIQVPETPVRPKLPDIRPVLPQGRLTAFAGGLLLQDEEGPTSTTSTGQGHEAVPGIADGHADLPAPLALPTESGSLDVSLPESQPEGLVQSGLAAMLLGLHDAGMFVGESIIVEGVAAVGDVAGLAVLSVGGTDGTLVGAGLAEYIPALETAALNFALNHQFTALQVTDELFSLLSSVQWQHVAIAGVVATAGYLGYLKLRPRRGSGLWADPRALLWNPQLVRVRAK